MPGGVEGGVAGEGGTVGGTAGAGGAVGGVVPGVGAGGGVSPPMGAEVVGGVLVASAGFPPQATSVPAEPVRCFVCEA